jgi:CRP/FNR family transcriptional regulator, cyclic AMP receptor protein
MEELLTLADGLPRRTLEAGEVLVTAGTETDIVYVLLEGGVRIERAGVAITTVTEPGACIGEMSILLDAPATSDVVAFEPSIVAVADHARDRVLNDPTLSLALARMLASRLHLMTTYLADLKKQYADHEGGLGMVDTVLGSLMRTNVRKPRVVSERDPDPEY